jgi:actin related protein 2/3 complex subunit 3
MPGAYHSEFNTLSVAQVCACAVLPIKTKVRGPAPQAKPDEEDIIDEVLKYFKANVLFRTYEVKGPADRVLLYLTFYVHLCLLRIERKKIANKGEAEKLLFSLAQESATLAAPGESGFILGGYCTAPTNNQEKQTWIDYMKQAREEIGARLVPLVFDSPDGPNKYWMQFTRRKFLNKAFEN